MKVTGILEAGNSGYDVDGFGGAGLEGWDETSLIGEKASVFFFFTVTLWGQPWVPVLPGISES